MEEHVKEIIVMQNNKGVTLIEVLIALVVLLIVFMGLIQASILSIEHNLRNEIREEAVRIATDNLTTARSASFDSVIDSGPDTITRNIRNISNFPFTVTRTVTDLNTDNKQVSIRVTYKYRDETYNYDLITTVRRQ